jgi:hypothetical protein
VRKNKPSASLERDPMAEEDPRANLRTPQSEEVGSEESKRNL